MYKVMALDIGTKRIGIALSDYLLMLANGHSYISRVPESDAVKQIERLKILWFYNSTVVLDWF